MNRSDEHFLLALANAQEDLDEDIHVFENPEEDGWAIVFPAFREAADRLVALGLAEKHPTKRRTRWYRITDKGEAHVEQIRYDIEQGLWEEAHPRWVNQAIAAYRRRYTGPQPGDARLIHRLIRFEALNAYRILAREQAAEGYAYIPEPGRYPDALVVAFYSIYSGRFRLFTYRTYGITTAWREVRYTYPGEPNPDLEDVILEDPPF
jgi:hypothetical protein